jgi:EamA domain-containing membrane protein RarD
MSQDRSLRVLTLLTTATAFPLLIVATALSFEGRNSGRAWWDRPKVTTFCFGYIPLFFTAVSAIIAIKWHERTPILTVSLLDLAGAISYVALLIPIWAIDVGRMNKGGLGLLVGYTTAPLILNM